MTPLVLPLGELHGSLADPLMEVMNFLNEITLRHPDAISFGPGRPYEGFFETGSITAYLETWTRHLTEDLGRTPDQVRTSLFQYGRTNGQIHELIARTLRNDEGIETDPAAVVVTVGCQEAMLITLRALFAGPSDVLLVTDPVYVGIAGAARLLGIETVPVAEDDSGVSPEALLAAVQAVRAAGKRPRALYTIPDFSNPSGASLPLERRHELLRIADSEDLLVLEDNPYGFFTRTGTVRPTLKALDTRGRVIHLGSFAKTCFPGARVGYIIADQTVTGPDGRRTLLADELSKIKSMVTVNTPTLSQALIGGMLLTHDCRLREANKQAVDFYRTNLDVLLTSLGEHFPAAVRERTGIGWNTPDGGFFLTLTLPFPADDALLRLSASEHGVIWTPMRYFHTDHAGDNRLRLSCSYLSPDAIREGVRRLAAVVERRMAQ
ncbi:PLP-dependent aminotransferase family protein [Streptomyces sp. NPDC001262]|uniref:aminotransferase-like domain-containing protein n=1 Tax=unclassified Streptomyces TaxID=2593676 RepID=UPI0036C4CE8A